MLKIAKYRQKMALAMVTALASVSSFAVPALPPPSAFEPIVADINGAKAPIAAVAGASLGAYVGIRVWKLVRRAI